MEGTRPSASRRAYAHVKERVLDGRLAEGTLLSEVEVAAELSVSRTPVREAFVQLESEGVLRLYPRRGALVVPIGPRDVADLVEARWVIERHALEQLGTDDEAFAAMQAAIAAQREHLAAGDEAAFAAQDRQFHRAAVAATGNAILCGLYDSLRERQQRMARRSMAVRADAILDEHTAILDALRAGDPAAAAEVLRRHLDSVADPRLGR
jgi:DNA-binding GntR family transcriptional regulator